MLYTHSGEALVDAITPVLLEMEIVSKLGYFMADNAEPNDTCIRALLRQLRPDIQDPDARRTRCLNHIINLVAKALLFGKDTQTFDFIDHIPHTHLDILLREWRKKGTVGKFHNTMLFIRRTSQRREEFIKCGGEIEDEIGGRIKNGKVNNLALLDKPQY